jgi:hypothetical protein
MPPGESTKQHQQPLSFETEVAAAAAHGRQKRKTRKESTPIKVWVTPEEKAAIAAKADAHSLSASLVADSASDFFRRRATHLLKHARIKS